MVNREVCGGCLSAHSFGAKTNPAMAPQAPPMRWADCEILSEENIPLKTSLPRYKKIMRMKVRGISFSLKEVMEARMMKAKTTPEAPNRALDVNMLLMIAVMRAVAPMTIIIRSLPYFSSNMGPKSRKKSMLLM